MLKYRKIVKVSLDYENSATYNTISREESQQHPQKTKYVGTKGRRRQLNKYF